ncbi:unnamed protein product [Ranitomeya imitator]|uniref:Helix-turn-helix domain-containing protein n=1 Tax=Ranitomeya imitator TaxID=111125 RepID=A0ABN9MDN9_9NEOB|nr:unnamed protein product [Ranitomeya imitator]
MTLTLDQLNKEIKNSQDKVSSIETQLKDSLPKDEFDSVKTRTKENVDNFRKETEKQIYCNALFKSHCILWRRYIDDVFCLWKGTGESLQEFFDQINSVWPELSFTLNFDRTEINFLDTKVIQKSDGTLTIDLFVKETDRNNLLLYQSCHPKAVKRSIPQSQFERVRRIVSDSTLCSQRLDEMETKFLQRGYPRRILQQSRRNVSRENNTRSSCAQCANVLKGPKISHPQTGSDIPIQGFFTCNSKEVVYAIKCPCGKMYVGETTQAIKDRISHHKSDIRCGKYHLPIPNHFREAGHTVAQLRFLVLEQAAV